MVDENSKVVEDLAGEVERLKKERNGISFGDIDCCSCCIGLAVGYMLFAPPSTKGAAISIYDKVQGAAQAVEIAEPSEPSNFLLKQIQNYQVNVSPRIKEDLCLDRLCKFTPSCSEYARQSIEKHGTVKGSFFAAGRLVRCNPLADGGYDPVK